MKMDCYDGDGTESCSSRAAVEYYSSSSSRTRRQREKADEILCRLRELGVDEAWRNGFDSDLSAHFTRLPYRYALDMSVEKAQDVLMHKKLLQMARDPATRPAIDVRPLQPSSFEQNGGNSVHLDTSSRLDAQGTGPTSRLSVHPAPDLWPNLNTSEAPGSHVSDSSTHSDSLYSGTMYEITISTNDKRKFLSQLTHLMSGLGLNIHEAHAFSTEDGYSLDIFVVACLEEHGAEELKATLVKELLKTERRSLPARNHVADAIKKEKSGVKLMPKHANVSKGEDFWEIDANLLMFEEKLASGSFGDLFKGTYLGQDVAIKVFQSEHINKALQQEFTQEILVLRKIQHKNIVKFIGASKRPPRLCIVTEYMPGGSVFDFLRKQKDVLELPVVLRIANDVAMGMNYLHHNKIIHRDLKAANLLMDENNVVKIADFGVAKIQTQPGVMTAETGTYRWMAPEVIEHKPYNHKADVFSFGVVLWELITGKLPYEELTPLQAAIGVVQKGLRPTIPSHTHPAIEKLLNSCWQRDPSTRPEFSEIVEILNHISNTAKS